MGHGLAGSDIAEGLLQLVVAVQLDFFKRLQLRAGVGYRRVGQRNGGVVVDGGLQVADVCGGDVPFFYGELLEVIRVVAALLGFGVEGDAVFARFGNFKVERVFGVG